MDDANPYAPPKADVGPAPESSPDGAPRYKLYSPGQVALAAFLGTPLGGMALHATNQRRRGQDNAASATLILGVGLTAVLILAGLVLPEAVGRVLPMAATFAIFSYAKRDEPLFQAHVRRGGQRESSWKAAGIGLLSALVVIIIMAPLLYWLG